MSGTRIVRTPADAIPPEPEEGGVVTDAEGVAWQRDDTEEPLGAHPEHWYPSAGPFALSLRLSWAALVATHGPLLVLAEMRMVAS